MNILHFEKNFNYNDRDLLHVVRKLGKLATYCKRLKDESSCIKIEVEKRATKKARDEIKVIILIELPDKILKADSRKDNVIEAVDRCIEKIEPQVKKYKDMHTPKQTSRRARRNGKSRRA